MFAVLRYDVLTSVLYEFYCTACNIKGTRHYRTVCAACSFTPPTSFTKILDLTTILRKIVFDFHVPHFLSIAPLVGVISNIFE